MMDADNGIVNKFLGLFGVDPVWWLQADHSLWSVIIANIWLGIPFNLVILYAGLQNINGDLYEAAAIDGANAWQRFWKITFPPLAASDSHYPYAGLRLYSKDRRHYLDHDPGYWYLPDPCYLGLCIGFRQG